MNNFLPVKRNLRPTPLRLVARMICILTLALWGPARAGAQEQPQPLNVATVNGKLTLTYKLKTSSSTDYAWFHKIGTNGIDTEFSGTLTGTNDDWKNGAIDIESEKELNDANDLDSYPVLQLDGLNLTSTTSLFNMLENSKPLCIQAIGQSASTLKSQGIVINNNQGGILLLDGGTEGLDILGTGDSSYGIYLFTTGPIANGILKGKINIVANRAVNIENSSRLSVTDAAEVRFSSWTEATCVLRDHVISPFLEWRFESAPETDKMLEIKDANGNSFDPAIQFKTDGNNKSFAINVAKNAGYTVWLGDDLLMDENRTTVFTATDNKLFPFEKMQLPTDWPTYGKTVSVGPDGTDVSVSNTTYTVKTPRGLAWIAWVTNNGKTKEGNANDYYPTSSGFKNCTVTLANDISLAKPKGVTADFVNNWVPIGTYSFLSSSDYTKCFQGTFDGNDKTITGMTISSSSVEYIGLFGYLYGATVKDLTMVDGEGSDNIKLTTITASATTYPLGSIAGNVENGKIINCHNRCAVSFSVSEKSGKVGGIAGSIKNSVLSACSNSGAIAIIQGEANYGGGIVGVNNRSSIVSCFNTGNINVTADKYMASAGGIMGGDDSYNEGNNIVYCYSTGDITSKTTQSSAAGSIVGYARCAVIKSCFATGTVSAESSSSSEEACAGGIIGWIWSDINNSVTVENCLALNTGGVKATGTTPKKQASRIVGKNNDSGNGKVTLSNNYASTNIRLAVGDMISAPTDNIGGDKVNGADLYLDEAAAVTASWAGPEDTKAFTAIGTDAEGKLPQLKAIATLGGDGLPDTYGNSAMEHQPSLPTSGYLALLQALKLPASAPIITLSFSDGKWSYKKGDEAPIRFDGTVKMSEGVNKAEIALAVSTATGNPTLTFENVYLDANSSDLLTIHEGCDLTLHTTGDQPLRLSSNDSFGLLNKGTLRVTGKGLSIEKVNPVNYGLDNSGIFMVPDLAETSVVIFGDGQTIRNTGTLDNAWMEWQFESYPGKIAFAATDATNPSPDAQACNRYKFATTVASGQTYRLWKVTGDSPGEVRTRQKGKASNGTTVCRFPAPAANEVAVYTNMEDVKAIAIADAKNFSEADCSGNDVTVKAGGVLTVDADEAQVLNLKLEEGGQVVTTNALMVDETFSTTRTLGNRWIAFGSPLALKASVGEAEGQLLYLATGYNDSDPLDQCWENVSGFPDTGKKTADLDADSPYLLAAEVPSTEVTFAAEASNGRPAEIPEAARVTLGADLQNGQFLFRTNPNLAKLTLSNIYVLNREGTLFELQTGNYELKPFEAYVAANAVTCSRIRSLRIGKEIPTGIEQPLAAGTRIWGTGGRLHISADAPADIVVVTPAGHTLRAFRAPVGDTMLMLPAGIYFVRCNDITYKVSL